MLASASAPIGAKFRAGTRPIMPRPLLRDCDDGDRDQPRRRSHFCTHSRKVKQDTVHSKHLLLRSREDTYIGKVGTQSFDCCEMSRDAGPRAQPRSFRRMPLQLQPRPFSSAHRRKGEHGGNIRRNILSWKHATLRRHQSRSCTWTASQPFLFPFLRPTADASGVLNGCSLIG